MKREDAKQLILSQWPKWRETNIADTERPSGTDGLIFYQELRRERPDLFHFPGGNKWKAVHAWLKDAKYVYD